MNEKLRALVQAALPWASANLVRPSRDNPEQCSIGAEDEEGNFYSVVTVNCDLYYQDSKPLADFIAAANSKAVLALLDENKALEIRVGQLLCEHSDLTQRVWEENKALREALEMALPVMLSEVSEDEYPQTFACIRAALTKGTP